MARVKAAYQQHQITLATKAFERAGFPPHRARVTANDVTIYFSPTIDDAIFDQYDKSVNVDEWGDYLNENEQK